MKKWQNTDAKLIIFFNSKEIVKHIFNKPTNSSFHVSKSATLPGDLLAYDSTFVWDNKSAKKAIKFGLKFTAEEHQLIIDLQKKLNFESIKETMLHAVKVLDAQL